MIKLSKRLETISSLVPINSNIIDIGCDHALLDIYLYQNKISNNIIASDINSNALNNAKNNIKKNNLDSIIETRLGNGLETLNDNDNVDTIIISGMGAHTAVCILKNNKNKLKKINTIIIQSNTKLELLRREVSKLNYMINNEIMVEDNKKTYTIIKFIKGKKKYTKKELDKLNIYMKLLPKNHIIDRYKIKKEIRLYHNVID